MKFLRRLIIKICVKYIIWKAKFIVWKTRRKIKTKVIPSQPKKWNKSLGTSKRQQGVITPPRVKNKRSDITTCFKGAFGKCKNNQPQE